MSFFIRSSAAWRLGCFQVLATVNDAAMNTGVRILLWVSASDFFGCVLRRALLGCNPSRVKKTVACRPGTEVWQQRRSVGVTEVCAKAVSVFPRTVKSF